MSSAAAAVTPDQTRDYGVLRWLVAAAFVVILNETTMAVALPRLMEEFQVDERTGQWLTTAFLLTMAVVIPMTGWFLQRVTTRQAFALAMGVFSAGTLLAALAPVFWVLILARVVQASGTAVMMPLLMTTIMSVVAMEDRGRVMGNVTLAISVAPALGPTMSGLVLQVTSWRWIFGVILPIAVAIALVGLSRLTNVGEPSAGTLHVPSVVLAGLGFGGFVYGLSLFGDKHAAVSPWLLVPAGLTLVVAFVALQLRLQRQDRPLLDLRTLHSRTYAISLVLMSLAFMGMFGSMILLPLYLQHVKGLSTLETGFLMMPGGLAMGLLGPRVGRWFDKVGSRPLVLPGGLAALVSLSIFATVGADTPIWLILGAQVLLMVGLAALFTPVFTLGLGAVQPHLYSHASSLLGATQQVAGAIGVATVIALMKWRATDLVAGGADPVTAQVGGFHWAFAFGAVSSVFVIALAALLPSRPDAPAHGPAPEEIDDAVAAEA